MKIVSPLWSRLRRLPDFFPLARRPPVIRSKSLVPRPSSPTQRSSPRILRKRLNPEGARCRFRGSGAGIKQFCDGVGEDKIDIANSSRRIKKSEQENCAKNGVADIVEVKFGYDGIVFASDVKGPSFGFQPKDWFIAIGAEVPVNGALAANPNKTWKEVNPIPRLGHRRLHPRRETRNA